MNYQWYPGHMTKARRQMQEDLKLIDLMIELVDARVPAASRNPDIDELGKNKARLILLNKSDLADERGNDAWMEYFKGKGYSVVKVNSRSGAGMKAINSAVQEACKEKIERDRKVFSVLFRCQSAPLPVLQHPASGFLLLHEGLRRHSGQQRLLPGLSFLQEFLS